MNASVSSGARHIDLNAETTSAGIARAFVRDTLSDWGYRQLEEEVCLAVSELVTNAVIHARSSASLTLLDLNGTVQVRVRDEEPTPPHITQATETDTGGRGMILVDALAKTWGVEPAPPGKIVWLNIAPPSTS